MMNQHTLIECLKFIERAENLKNTLRCSYTSQSRTESTAEHSWRLCLMVMVFADQLGEVDLLKMLKMCIIHDLGEAINGDIPAISKNNQNKADSERQDFQTLIQGLPNALQQEFLSLWDEYENATTYEARLIKGFDKLETMIQHNQGKSVPNMPDIDYTFNLMYGKQYMDAHPLLQNLRQVIDRKTALLAQRQKSSS